MKEADIANNITLKNSTKKGYSFFGEISLFTIVSLVSIVEMSLAVYLINCLWFFLGLLVIRVCFPATNRAGSYEVYLLFYIMYSMFMLITNYIYVSDPYKDFFFTVDSLEFYRSIDMVLQNYSGADAYDQVLYVARNWRGFGVLMWFTGKLANAVGADNSLVVQKAQIVFLSTMIPVFLYNMGRVFLNPLQTWKLALSFGLLTHALVFSGVFNRDVHIAFIYTAGTYVLLAEWKFRNYFVLIFLGFLAWQFRVQHGIFFICFILVYTLIRLKEFKSRILAFAFRIAVIGGFGAFVYLNMGTYQEDTTDKLEHYQAYHEAQFEEASGFTSIVSKLPPPLRPIANAAISQLYPYPPHRALNVNVINEKQLLKFPLAIAQIYWLFVWGFLIYGFLNIRVRKLISFKLKYALGLSILLILSISLASYEFRRMLGAYPVIYLASGVFYVNLDKRKRTRIIWRILLLQVIFFLLYGISKGF